MAPPTPKVSVIIATYCSGDGLDRVIESLDAQTLPQADFETIFVDDGSPDDTYVRILKLASTRPNLKAFRIENSGWPSRPRNVGMEHASGHYVFFMDHDDSLYPDGLRRAYEFAVETNADIVSPKESKTNDSWWGMSSLTQGNVKNVVNGEGIGLLLPLVPHKLYRRTMMDQHKIRFPDGREVLWEDQFINIDAYRRAERVAILADSPTYLWHSSETNTSHTFSPAKENFWQRLEQLLKFVVETLAEPRLHSDRDAMLTHHMKTRVIDRTVRQLVSGPQESGKLALNHARRLQSRYLSDEVFARLPKKHKAQALLLRIGAAEALREMHRTDLRGNGITRAVQTSWDGSTLRLELNTIWDSKRPDQPILKRTPDGRVLRVLQPQVQALLPENLCDVTADLSNLATVVILRGRQGFVSWEVPLDQGDVRFVETENGLAARGAYAAVVDVRAAELGRQLSSDVWDLRYTADWFGMTRVGAVRCATGPLPALIHNQTYIAYSNSHGGLTIDMTQRHRCLATDAEPRLGPVGHRSSIEWQLQNLHIVGESTLDDTRLSLALAADEAVVAEGGLNLDDPRAVRVVGRIVADETGGRLLGQVDQELQQDAVYAVLAHREDRWRSTRYCVRVLPDEQLELALRDTV